MARYLCAFVLGVNEIEKMAFVARMGTVWVAVVDARQRILEDRFFLPRSMNRTSVSALLNEIKFLFEQFENVAIVISHGSLLHSGWPNYGRLPLLLLNQSRHPSHLPKSNA